MEEKINHPKHYNSHPSGVECIDIAEHFNFNLGNALKYIWRAGLKGDLAEDLKKAAFYIDREIKRIESLPKPDISDYRFLNNDGYLFLNEPIIEKTSRPMLAHDEGGNDLYFGPDELPAEMPSAESKIEVVSKINAVPVLEPQTPIKATIYDEISALGNADEIHMEFDYKPLKSPAVENVDLTSSNAAEIKKQWRSQLPKEGKEDLRLTNWGFVCPSCQIRKVFRWRAIDGRCTTCFNGDRQEVVGHQNNEYNCKVFRDESVKLPKEGEQ